MGAWLMSMARDAPQADDGHDHLVVQRVERQRAVHHHAPLAMHGSAAPHRQLVVGDLRHELDAQHMVERVARLHALVLLSERRRLQLEHAVDVLHLREHEAAAAQRHALVAVAVHELHAHVAHHLRHVALRHRRAAPRARAHHALGARIPRLPHRVGVPRRVAQEQLGDVGAGVLWVQLREALANRRPTP